MLKLLEPGRLMFYIYRPRHISTTTKLSEKFSPFIDLSGVDMIRFALNVRYWQPCNLVQTNQTDTNRSSRAATNPIQVKTQHVHNSCHLLSTVSLRSLHHNVAWEKLGGMICWSCQLECLLVGTANLRHETRLTISGCRFLFRWHPDVAQRKINSSQAIYWWILQSIYIEAAHWNSILQGGMKRKKERKRERERENVKRKSKIGIIIRNRKSGRSSSTPLPPFGSP